MYRSGYWTFSYQVDGNFDELGISELKGLMKKVKGHETGWPVWMVPDKFVSPFNGLIEAWLVDSDRFDDPSHADFWRASPQAKFFLLRGYREDSQEDILPGKTFDYIIPVWSVSECLLHAKRMASEIAGEDASITVEARWTGLTGRRLSSIFPRGGLLPPPPHECKTNEMSAEKSFSTSEIEDNLPEVVETLIRPLYQQFNFYEPSSKFIQQQINNFMR